MRRLFEHAKVEMAVVPTALNNTNLTGRYFAMKNWRRIWFIGLFGALAATKTAKIEAFEATDASGSGAQLISGATATVTANAAVTKATAALATVLAADTITINGLTFTAHASTTTVANREFSIGGTDTQDGDALVTCINDPTYGVPGVTASNSSGTLTLTVTDPGSRTLTLSASSSTFTLATVESLAYIEINGINLSSGFTHVACKLTTTGNGVFGALLLRGDPRDTITQYVGASAAV